MAALDNALLVAIGSAPEESHREMKLAVGRAMSAIMDETINPAIRAYPELDPTDEIWREVVKARVSSRAASFAPDA
jgi:hypothetical protein